ncbi:MAG: hypothetical protein QGF61_02850 [Pelagibacteraceae bacterium]|jgi:CRISPR/Cas system Type II protein with McrA/HNH and RuvC-like nuclease domain|nr:hypothetical protein [Pelagibacteraceae bacterium]|tara:strand:+ start:807 stop:1190 length:384 start_codon:yes stop_codon:yes gene_type:complete
MKTKVKNLTRGQIRTLLKLQNGRCAISGQKLKPADVSVDHIIPLSRYELNKKKGYGKYWLVSSKVNKLKGSLTADELYKLINEILNYKRKSTPLMNHLINSEIKETSKEDFDKYIKKNYDKSGIIKK